jgi:hypothetical protein
MYLAWLHLFLPKLQTLRIDPNGAAFDRRTSTMTHYRLQLESLTALHLNSWLLPETYPLFDSPKLHSTLRELVLTCGMENFINTSYKSEMPLSFADHNLCGSILKCTTLTKLSLPCIAFDSSIMRDLPKSLPLLQTLHATLEHDEPLNPIVCPFKAPFPSLTELYLSLVNIRNFSSNYMPTAPLLESVELNIRQKRITGHTDDVLRTILPLYPALHRFTPVAAFYNDHHKQVNPTNADRPVCHHALFIGRCVSTSAIPFRRPSPSTIDHRPSSTTITINV